MSQRQEELVRMAHRRLINDPEFHAIVYMGVESFVNPERFPDEDVRTILWDVSILSAAVALILKERRGHGDRWPTT